MSTKHITIGLVIGLLSVSFLGLATLTQPARAVALPAQPEIAQTESACNNCHDNQYYLYDRGKAYCVAHARTRCVDCHNGDPTALDKITAHTNLVAWPVRAGNDSKCQSCHRQDVKAHVERFAAIAGFSPAADMPQNVYNYIPSPVSNAAPTISAGDDLPWQAKILVGLATVLLLAGGLVLSGFFHH
jgi:hypothetical protein